MFIAQADDAEAPPLTLADEDQRARRQLGVEVDLVGFLFGSYGLRLGATLGPYQALFVAPSYRRVGGLDGAGLELEYEVRPLGRGLDGLHIGVFVGGSYFPAGQVALAARQLRFGGDAGYTYLWGQLLVGAAVGAAHSVTGGPLPRPRRVEVVCRALLGFAFL